MILQYQLESSSSRAVQDARAKVKLLKQALAKTK